MTNLNDPHQLEHVLEALGANNTEIIRQAESILKPFLKSILSVPALLHQIEFSTNVSVRHVSALILKKRINNLYSKCGDAEKASIKINILRLVTIEPVKPVRTAIAGAAATLAKNIFSTEGNWPEILDLLIYLLASPDENLRALCFNLLGQLAEHVSEYLKAHTGTLADMLLRGCKDDSHTVAVAALSASTILIGSLSDEEEVMVFKNILSDLLTVMAKCLENHDEDVVAEGLDMIQECVAMEKPLVNDHIQHIVPFAVSIMGNFSLESSTRNAAGQTIMSIIEMRPKLLAKQNLVQPILEVFVQAIANSDSSGCGTLFTMGDRLAEEADDDDDEDYQPSMELTQIAQMCLDRMSLSMTSKAFAGPVLEIVSNCMQSPDKNFRKAGCAVLGIICEGCCDAIRVILPDVLPPLLQAVADPEYYVRESACFALGQFSEHCQPEILYHHQAILPVIFGALLDERPTVQGTSCYVLENFCENLLPHTLRPFLPTLMERLGHVLTSPHKTTQEMALAAIAATAVASELNFLPYTAGVIAILQNILFISEPEMINIRGRGLECLGHIAVAVGPVHFEPYFGIGLQAALQGIQIGEDSLKEYAYTYVANCAKVMTHAFDPHLQNLVPHLLEVISESELAPYTGDDDDVLGGLDDEDEVDEDGNEQFHLTTHEGFVNSKKAALCAIGSLADHTGASFYPYVEQTLNILLAEENGTLWSFHRIIRAEALLTLQYLVKVVCLQFGPVNPPGKGEVIEMNPVVRECVIAVLTTCMNSMVTDIEKLPAAFSIESLESTLKLVGVAGMLIQDAESGKSYGDLIMQNIITLLKEKGKSQTVMKREEDDDEDDDHDNLVMDAVCDLIATLAKILGENYLEYFDPMTKYLLKFTKKTRPHSDRAMAIGCFAEVVNEVGQVAGDKYADVLLPILREGLGDSMESVRRNASYGVGILCQRSPQKVGSSCLQMLQWLHPLCVRPSDEILSDVGGADSDNALAAVSRMIMNCQGIPLGQVLPVLLNALPIRSDFGEGQTIFQCLAQLLHSSEPTVCSFLPQVVLIMSDSLKEDSRYNSETKVIAIQTFKFLAQEKRDMLMAAIDHITTNPLEVRQIVENAVNS